MFREYNSVPALQVDSSLVLECKAWLEKTTGIKHDWNTRHAEILAYRCTDDLWCWANSKSHKAVLLNKEFTHVGYYRLGYRACARFHVFVNTKIK